MVEWFEKFSLNFSIFVVCNPCQSSPSLTILVPLRLIIISLVFSDLSYKCYFQVSFNLNGDFVDVRNNSKYREVAPLIFLIKLQFR